MFQQEQNVFNLLLGAVSEGVIVVDENQKIVETNDSANKMFGYKKGELFEQSLNILIPKNYHAGHGKHFSGFMKQRERRRMGQGRDIFGARKDGSAFPVEAGLNPFTLFKKNYVMALVIDISVRKEQEEKIQNLNVELEKKVEERTKELETSIKKLRILNIELDKENKKRITAEEEVKDALEKEKALNDLKSSFLSLVSHEFKTPLSGILTSTILLGKYKLAEQQKKRDKHIKTIVDKVHFLNNILNDFLSIEKLETGKINYRFSNFKLSKVVNEVVYDANMLLKEGQQINYPENIDDLSLYQDEKAIQLIFSNLLHNAIKYSPEATVIDLHIKQDNNSTTLKVKDKGVGIPKKDQKNIFERYFRAENVINIQGTGIGLNIAKNHLENLGGTISFESKENIGSTFTITFPNKANQ